MIFSNSHDVVPALIALHFDLAARTRQITAFFFTHNILMKIHSIFLVLGFLTGIGVMGDLGLLLVNPPGVETIAALRIALYCFWS